MVEALGSSGQKLVNFKINKNKIKTSCLDIQFRDLDLNL
jgi:hypothetical protein